MADHIPRPVLTVEPERTFADMFHYQDLVPKSPSLPEGTRGVDVPSQIIRPSRDQGIRLSTPTGLEVPTLGEMKVPPSKLPYRTFSGCDITCIVHVIGNDGVTEPVIIANAQTISYSVHREKFPVRVLGRTYATGYTRGCVGAGTLIHTMKGQVPIEDISVGDYVLSYNQDSKVMEYKKCTGKVFSGYKPTYKITLKNGQVTYLTGDHKVICNGKWIRTDECLPNDEVIVPNGSMSMNVEIKSIESSTIMPTYDIEVEDNHNFCGPYVQSNSRTIAGSIIFTMFDREILWELLQGYKLDIDYTDDSYTTAIKTPLIDQLPPFDITIEFSNEYGHKAFMAIYGVELSDEGAVMSIDDMLVEKTVQYIARDIDILRPSDIEDVGTYEIMDSTGVSQEDYSRFLKYLSSRRRGIDGGKGDDLSLYDIPYDAALFQAQSAKYDLMQNDISVGSTVVYTTSDTDHEGRRIVWAGRVTSIRGNVATFIPSSSLYSLTTDGKYMIYDNWHDRYPSKNNISDVPPNMLIPINGVRVDTGYLRSWEVPISEE